MAWQCPIITDFFYHNLIEGLFYVVLLLSWPKVEQQPKELQKGHRKVLKELQQTVFQGLICRLVQLPFLRVYLDIKHLHVSIIYCCSGTFPLGHLYSRDTSIQGTQGLVLEKHPYYNCFIYYLYWEDTSIQGKRDTFWAPKPGFNLHSGDTLALKKWLTTKRVDFFQCSPIPNYLNQCNALVWIHLNYNFAEIS